MVGGCCIPTDENPSDRCCQIGAIEIVIFSSDKSSVKFVGLGLSANCCKVLLNRESPKCFCNVRLCRVLFALAKF